MASTDPDSQPAVPQKALSPGELAPHFPQLEILECLGRGGMGVVYKARQRALNRIIALKLLAPERVGDPLFAERFAREAQALAALNHPNIVTVHDFGQAGGFYYLLMEFVDGVNLRQAMKAARFTPEQALAVVPPVCEALQYAHEHGIVHRDIKPENLLLDKEGRVKIADFGIAKILNVEVSDVGVADSQPAGTPQYMAPEQKDHRRTDHRADIYSLGVVLYELLTGELPGKLIEAPSKKVTIDVRLDEIVLRALEREPERRYQTAAEVRTQVETIAGALTAFGAQASTGSEPMPPGGGTPAPGAKQPRFSRMAIAGAFWAFAAISIPVVVMCFEVSAAGAYRALGLREALLGFLARAFIPLGLTAPFGATVLGWISVRQIQRSAGKLCGLGLAVFDGLLFPLLALDGGIVWLLKSLTQLFADLYSNPSVLNDPRIHAPLTTRIANLLLQHPELAIFVAVVVVFVVDFFIIRCVWRAVNKRTANSSQVVGVHAPAAPQPPSKVDWTTWSPFQPPLVREVCAHMTKAEKSENMKRGLLFGIWNAGTVFGPFYFVQFSSLPSPMNWIYGGAILIVGLSFYPLWRRMVREFLCATAWARQQGIRPEQLKQTSSSDSSRLLSQLGIIILVCICGVAAFAVFLVSARVLSRASNPTPASPARKPPSFENAQLATPPDMTPPAAPQIRWVDVDRDRAIVKGWGLTNSRIVISVGSEGNWSCGFATNTYFNAFIEPERGTLKFTVNDPERSILALTLTQAGSTKFDRGRFIFKESRGSPWTASVRVGTFQPETGDPLSIIVSLEKPSTPSVRRTTPSENDRLPVGP